MTQSTAIVAKPTSPLAAMGQYRREKSRSFRKVRARARLTCVCVCVCVDWAPNTHGAKR